MKCEETEHVLQTVLMAYPGVIPVVVVVATGAICANPTAYINGDGCVVCTRAIATTIRVTAIAVADVGVIAANVCDATVLNDAAIVICVNDAIAAVADNAAAAAAAVDLAAKACGTHIVDVAIPANVVVAIGCTVGMVATAVPGAEVGGGVAGDVVADVANVLWSTNTR